MALTAKEHEGYYLGYSNSVLWPVFHNRLDLAQFEAGLFRNLLDVNRRFASPAAPLLQPDDIIWVHDYHLILLAPELRKLGVREPDRLLSAYSVPALANFYGDSRASGIWRARSRLTT